MKTLTQAVGKHIWQRMEISYVAKEEQRPPASSNVSGSSWKWILQPQSSLWMTALLQLTH